MRVPSYSEVIRYGCSRLCHSETLHTSTRWAAGNTTAWILWLRCRERILLLTPYAYIGGKSCKRMCHKTLRHFTLPCPGYRHGAPKAVYIIPYDDLCRFPAISSRLRILFKTLISTVSAYSTPVCSQICGQKTAF